MDFAHSGHFADDVPEIEQCSARKFCLLYIFNDSGGYYILFDGEIEDKSHLRKMIFNFYEYNIVSAIIILLFELDNYENNKDLLL